MSLSRKPSEWLVDLKAKEELSVVRGLGSLHDGGGVGGHRVCRRWRTGEWKTLLDPVIVNEVIMTRSEAANPTARRARELSSIRAMQVTITNVARSEI